MKNEGSTLGGWGGGGLPGSDARPGCWRNDLLCILITSSSVIDELAAILVSSPIEGGLEDGCESV